MGIYRISDSEGLEVSVELSSHAKARCKDRGLTELGVLGCIITIVDTLLEGKVHEEFAVIDVGTYCTIVGVLESDSDGIHIIIKTVIDSQATFFRRGTEVITIDSISGMLLERGHSDANNSNSNG